MSIIPDQFEPPRMAALRGFDLEVLSPVYADEDFAAVTASADSIRHVFRPENDWPAPGMTFPENKADLVRHEREFNERSAFAYALLDPSGTKYLGCLYLRPIKSKTGRDRRQERFSAQAFLWMSVLHPEVTEESVHATVHEWFTTKWDIKAVAWPGRNPSWSEWKLLAELPPSAA